MEAYLDRKEPTSQEMKIVAERQEAPKNQGKAIPVTGRGGPYGCETSRLQHFLDNRLTDGGEAVSLTSRPLFTPRKIPCTHFC
jgi:hypothetical protein